MTDQSDPSARRSDDATRHLSDTTMSFSRVHSGSIPRIDDPATASGLTAEEGAAVAALPGSSALLIMQRGPSAGARYLLDADSTVAGRSEDAEIFLDDVTVSRRHAEFRRQDGDFLVRDVGSLNGTYVNRQRIDAAVLRTGDEVQIGKYRLVFFRGPLSGAAGQGSPA